MLLKVTYFTQPTVYSCVPGSLKMLTAYHGISITTKKIVEEVKCTPTGTYMETAAEYLARLMANPTLVFFDPKLYPSWYQKASQAKIIEHLRDEVQDNTSKRKQRNTNALRQKKLMYFMSNGGKFLTRLSLTDLKELIKNKRPVIVSVELNHLYPEECVPEDEYHTVVAIGYSKDKILFLDPGLKGIHSDNEEHFVWSWHANYGGALFI